MAFPAWVGVSTALASTTGGTIDFTASGRASGDKLYIAVVSANEAIATPAGYTELSVSPQSHGTAAAIGGIRLALFQKTSDGTETTAVIADSGNHQYAVGFVVRPASGQSIEIDASAGKSAAASFTHSGNAVTTTAPDCLVVDVWGTDQDGAGLNYSGHANASLTSLTERFDSGTSAGVGSGIAVITGQKATAGSVAATTASSLGSVAWCAITLALKSVGVGYTLTASGDTVTTTGAAAGLLAARKVSAVGGAFALTGSDTPLIYGGIGDFTLVASGGSFSLSGQAVGFARGRRLGASAGTIALVGGAVGFAVTRGLAAGSGTFTLTGFGAADLDFRPRGPIGGLPICCERCGFRVKPGGLRKEWTNLMVCRPCWDPRPADTRPPILRPEGLPRRDSRLEPPPVFRAEGELGGGDL